MFLEVMKRVQKMEQIMDFQSNKIDELLERQMTNDKVLHRMEAKLDKIMQSKPTNNMNSSTLSNNSPSNAQLIKNGINDSVMNNIENRQSTDYFNNTVVGGMQQQMNNSD